MVAYDYTKEKLNIQKCVVTCTCICIEVKTCKMLISDPEQKNPFSSPQTILNINKYTYISTIFFLQKRKCMLNMLKAFCERA